MRKSTYSMLFSKALAGSGRLTLALVMLASILFSAFNPEPALAVGSLTIEPLTWNVIGLDSNNVNVGPSNFPVGARVCNTSLTPSPNTVVTFTWDDGLNKYSGNPFINLRGGTLDAVTLSLAAGECKDAYFEVAVTRTSSAYNKTRGYTITANDGAGGVATTSSPRELLVEYLISQNRNSVLDMQFASDNAGTPGAYTSVAPGGTMALAVGNTYWIKLVAKTATNGYEQLESFVNFPNTIFRLESASTSYTADTSLPVDNPNDKVYGDACVWENNPTSPNYRSCLDVGKVGGDITVTYKVTILQVPGAPLVNPEPLSTLVYDFSGSSYHYNSDFSASTRFVQIVDPTTLSISKRFSPSPIGVGGISALTITISNPYNSAIGGVNYTDVFPTSPAVMTLADTTTSNTCGGTLTDSAGGSLNAGDVGIRLANGVAPANGSCSITVNVTAPSVGNYNNTTPGSGNLFIGANDTGKYPSAILTVTDAPLPPTPPAFCASPSRLASWNFSAGTDINGFPLYTYIAPDVSTATASYTTVSGTQSIISTAGYGNPIPGWSGTAPTAGAGWSETATSMANYFQFTLDTSKYGGVYVTFDSAPLPNGDWANPTSNVFVNTSADGGAFTVFTPYPQSAKGSWTANLRANAAVTGTSTTRFRLGIDSGSKSTAQWVLDNVTFWGCQIPNPPTVTKSFSPNPVPVGGTSTLTININNLNFTNLTGTVAVTTGSATVTGTGTQFTTQLAPGSFVRIGSAFYAVASIASNTSLTLATNSAITGSGLTISTGHIPLTGLNISDYLPIENLQGTVTTNGTTSVVGTGTLFTKQLAAGSIVYLPSTPATLTGTLSVTQGSQIVTGSGTLFSTQLAAGSRVTIASVDYTVASIASNTSLTLTRPYRGATGSGLTATSYVPVTYTVNTITNDTNLTLTANAPAGSGQVMSAGLTLTASPTTTCPAGTVTGASTRTAISLASNTLTGTVAVTNGSATVTGTGTSFTTALAVGSRVYINGVLYRVSAIGSATSLTLSSAYTGATASGLSMTTDSANLTGTVAVTGGSATVTGTGTTFTTQLSVGSIVTIAGVPYGVAAIASNTSLTLNKAYTGANASGLTMTRVVGLDGGATCTITATVKANAAGLRTNVTQMVSAQESGPNTTSTGYASAPLTALLPPVIDKVFSPNPVIVNGITRLTFNITNPNASDTLTGVAFTDVFPTFPGAMTVASPLVTNNTCGGSLLDSGGFGLAAGDVGIQLTGGSVVGGATCQVSVDVTVPTVTGNLTGTLSVTNGSASVTGSGTLFSTELAVGRTIYINGSAFVVASITSDTSLTLDRVFPGASASGIVVTRGYFNVSGVVTSTNGGTGNTASDTLEVDPATPLISLSKQVGTSASGPWSDVLQTGAASVYYRFVVENIGNVPLSPFSVTDPALNPVAPHTVACTWVPAVATLPVASATADPTAECIVGPYSTVVGTTINTATASGTNGGTTVTDTDKATYLKLPGSIGSRVWLDENSNGYLDAGETGLANVTVTLYASDGVTVVATTVTDSNGAYLFTNVPPGNYYVKVTSGLPAGATQTTTYPLAGAAFTNQDQSGSGYSLTVVSGHPNQTANFGYNFSPSGNVTGNTGTGSIGDRLWIDDGDGIDEPGEAGLGGVTVRLYSDPDGDGVYDNLVATTTSAADGSYRFNNVPAGAYVIEVNGGTNPAGYTQTGDPDTLGAACATCDNKTTRPIILAPGDVYTHGDFGYQPSGTAGTVNGTLWLNTDADNDVDAGETYRFSNVTVQLIQGGVVVATTTTDANGNYSFSGLPLGTYDVRVNDANGILTSLSPNYDSNGTGTPNVTTVTLSDATPSVNNFGYAPTGHDSDDNDVIIGSKVFFDANGSDGYDSGEGIGGVRVYLYDSTGVTLLAVTVTNANGEYLFGNLPAGTYVTKVDTSTIPGYTGATGGLVNTVDPDGVEDSKSSVVTVSGGQYLTQNYGYAVASGAGSISGTLWNDADSDAFQDAGETTYFSDVTVGLYFDANGDGKIGPGDSLIAKTTTNASGDYTFSGLPTNDGSGSNAQYIVKVLDETNKLDGYWHSWTTGNAGDDGYSRIDPYPVTLTPGSPSTSLADFGYYRDMATLSDFVWLDLNADGIQNDFNGSPEPGIAGVKVTLTVTYPGGAGTVTLVTYTDSNGQYSFGSLLLDENFREASGGTTPTLSLVFETPSGLVATDLNQGGNAALDSNGTTPTVTSFVKGASDSTYDSGFKTGGSTRLDFGDMLNEYRTRFSPGAAHIIFPDGGDNRPDTTDGRIAIWAGSIVDAENDTTPGNDAIADDNLGSPNDEDGFSFLTTSGWITSGNTQDYPGTVRIVVNSSAATRVYWALWVDWNANRVFENNAYEFYSGSRLTTSPANQDLTITMPSGYVVDTRVFIRLRVSDQPLTHEDYQGTILNGEVEDSWASFNGGGAVTTPVTLSYFSANRQGSGVVFNWSTATETGNVGFNLYVVKGKEKILVNNQLIPSKVIDSLEVQNYSYGAQLTGNVFYIEDVSILGETELHGPFVLGRAYGARLTNAPINLAAIQAEHERKDEQRQEQLSDTMVVPAEALAPAAADDATTPVARTDRTIPDRVVTITPMPGSTNIVKPGRTPQITMTARPGKTVKPTKTPRWSTPTATLTLTETPTNQPTYTPSATPTLEPTYTLSATPTWTAEPSATVEAWLEPTATDETENLVTPTETETPQESASATPTEAETETPSPTATATPTETETPTETPTASETPSPTATATWTETETPTETPTATETSLPTATATPTEVSALPVPYNLADLQLTTTFNLKVNKTGLYRVTYEQLQTAGLDLAGVPLEKLTVLNRDKMIPIYVSMPDQSATFGAGGYIEFYGEALDTLYTDTNIYTLQVNASPAPRVRLDNTVPDTSQPAPSFYLETLVVNRQRSYATSAQGNDPWYDTLMSVTNTLKSWNFTFQINDLVPSNAESLDLVVWGINESTVSPNHHLRVSLNGVLVHDEKFNGILEKTMKISLPAGVLREGVNTLQVIAPADTGASSDVMALDRFSVNYQRAFVAQNGNLSFTAAGSVFDVRNLPVGDLVVYRLSSAGLQRLQAVDSRAEGATYSASFVGGSLAESYLVTATTMLNTPVLEAVRAKADLDRPAQYLVIAHPDFISGLQPLVQARQAQGLSVSVVDVKDLYNQYSYGIFDPQAIKQYIAYAAKNLGTQYVLLVGGDTYDYRNYTGKNSVSFVPSLYVQTYASVKFIPSDPFYADLNGDSFPDLAIGRFPVRTTAELNQVISKTLAYGNKSYGRTAVFASDQNDGKVSFKAISDSLAAKLPAGWSAQNLHLDDFGVAIAKPQLLQAMNRGTALVSFTGHSGPTSWTFSNLFSTTDAAALSNAGKPFVAVQWGCWNTYYVNPTSIYLVQSLLFSGDKGAAAVLGATSLADAESERLLGELLMPRLVAPGVTLGDALQQAKNELAQTNPELLDVLLGWTLMGDPALSIVP